MHPTLGACGPASAVDQLAVDAALEVLELVDDVLVLELVEEPALELEDESVLEVLGVAGSLEELLERESLR